MRPDPDLMSAYEQETRPGVGRVDRLAASVLRHREATPRVRTWPLVGTGLAIAAVALFAISTYPTSRGRDVEGAVANAPERDSLHKAAALPEAQVVPLSSPNAPATATLSDGILLTYTGTGRAERDVVTWDVGALHVEVPSGQGLAFSVRTREGEARVVGTGFTVTRSEMGTDVDVRHGGVEVTCEGGSTLVVGPGQRRNCPPVSAAGLLARARALARDEAPAEQVLASIDAGLAHADAGGEGAVDEVVGHELRYLRAEVAYRAGRTEEARADLAAYLAGGATGRDADTLRLAAGLALEAGDCEAAVPPLLSLEAGSPSAADLVLLAECLAGEAPPRARAALVRALALRPDPATARRARAALSGLPEE